MQFTTGLEGVMHGHQEWTLPDRLQDLSLSLGVFGRLPLLDDGGLLQDLHGVELAFVAPMGLAGKEHLAVSWKIRKRKYENECFEILTYVECYFES